MSRARTALIAALVLLCAPATALAYVGPGAGFAFVSSIFTLLVATLLGLLTLLTWPVRWAVQAVRGFRAPARARVRRVIVLGVDGLDPDITERLMGEGRLPNLARLRDQGSFRRLRTTLLAESPVAWASFQTGCNPGKHRIYDFLVPNRRSGLPEPSDVRMLPPPRTLALGSLRIPLSGPLVEGRRRSRPFWEILSDHGVFSTILRVPVTFPAQPFGGVLLSATSTPDLRGSQGTYLYFSSEVGQGEPLTAGERRPIEVRDGVARATIPGPGNPLRRADERLSLPFEIRLPSRDGRAALVMGRRSYPLEPRVFTPWIPLAFRSGAGLAVRGMARFYLIESVPHVKLYVTPIHLDPDRPAMPISHPFTYAVYLSRTLGRYATLGVAEDLSAVNEGVLDVDAFLEQVYDVHRERESMFFDALEKTPRGAVVCVFDLTDRLQHMFFRHLDDTHPANAGRDHKHRDVIEQAYRRVDDLVGRTLREVTDDTVLLVVSDHGFKSFRRAVNLNTWLYREGFLALTGPPDGADMFRDVDWTRTRAYAVGFGGIYLNLAGREARGVVQPGAEAEQVRREIRDGLLALYDEAEGVHPVREVYDSRAAYSGPYVGEAPDLIVGFRPGHRVAWRSVTGGVGDAIVEDNVRPWSGDHNFNPPDVPGVLFCNRKVASDDPGITDICPTVLDLFGVRVPDQCDGRSLLPAMPLQREPPPAGAGVVP